jgi:hypothetical protein
MALYAADTRVPVAQSRAEIERLLERHKAKQYGTAVDYDLGSARVQFRLHDRVVRFSILLPDGKKLGAGERYQKAERQKWRALLLVIKAKLESVENGIEEFEQAFLGQIVLPNDQTVSAVVLPLISDAYKTGKMPRRLLEAGDPPDGKVSK